MNAQPVRLAVIDSDSGFLRVLTRRFETAGWEYRVFSGSVPADEPADSRVTPPFAELIRDV